MQAFDTLGQPGLGAHRAARPMLLLAAVFTAAGGYVHLAEWLEVYKDIPLEIPGSWLVRVGFPFSAGIAFVLALVLAWIALTPTRLIQLVLPSAILFNASSAALVIATRTGAVFGWSEPVWTDGAEQLRAVAIGALICLVGSGALLVGGRRPGRLG